MLTLKYKFNLVTFLNYFNFCLSNTKMRGEGKEGGGEGRKPVGTKWHRAEIKDRRKKPDLIGYPPEGNPAD